MHLFKRSRKVLETSCKITSFKYKLSLSKIFESFEIFYSKSISYNWVEMDKSLNGDLEILYTDKGCLKEGYNIRKLWKGLKNIKMRNKYMVTVFIESLFFNKSEVLVYLVIDIVSYQHEEIYGPLSVSVLVVWTTRWTPSILLL